jgi:hypothetical protein
MENTSIRHITFIKLKSTVTDEEKLEYENDAIEMLKLFNNFAKNTKFGKNLANNEFDYIINAEFNSIDDRTSYINHDTHKVFVNKWLERIEKRVSGALEI